MSVLATHAHISLQPFPIFVFTRPDLPYLLESTLFQLLDFYLEYWLIDSHG